MKKKKMKNIKYLTFLILFLTLTSCHWAKNKAKNAVSKTGEIVAKTGSEFGNGVYKGVKKTFQNNVQLSENLKKEGLKFGEISVNSTDSTMRNVLITYIIFSKDFDQDVTIKLFNENDKEYGRITEEIKGKKGQAKYFDFTFDERVNINLKGKITFE